MILQNQNIGDSALVESFEADVFPDATTGQIRTPVPAETARFLAHPGAALDPFVRRLIAFPLLDVSQRRLKRNLDRIFPGAQNGFYVKFPKAEHVVGAANFLAVDL